MKLYLNCRYFVLIDLVKHSYPGGIISKDLLFKCTVFNSNNPNSYPIVTKKCVGLIFISNDIVKDIFFSNFGYSNLKRILHKRFKYHIFS